MSSSSSEPTSPPSPSLKDTEPSQRMIQDDSPDFWDQITRLKDDLSEFGARLEAQLKAVFNIDGIGGEALKNEPDPGSAKKTEVGRKTISVGPLAMITSPKLMKIKWGKKTDNQGEVDDSDIYRNYRAFVLEHTSNSGKGFEEFSGVLDKIAQIRKRLATKFTQHEHMGLTTVSNINALDEKFQEYDKLKKENNGKSS